MKLLSPFCVLSLALPSFLLAQIPNGPGGVASANGASSLVLWLNAKTISAPNGSLLTSWADASGYGNNFTAGAGAMFTTNAQNSYPAFTFNGTSNYFETSAFNAVITPSVFTVYSAAKVLTSATYKTVLSNRDDVPGTDTHGFMLYSSPSANNWQFWIGNAPGWNILSSGVATPGNWSSQTIEYQNTGNGRKISVSNTVLAQNTSSFAINTARPVRVGAGANEGPADFFFNGDIGEIIMFNTILNPVQNLLINNYLAAKYDFTLAVDDIYTMDDAANGNFDHDVAGIGRVNGANLQSDARGTGMIRILNPSSLGNGDYYIWGHNNLVAQAGNYADIPPGVSARFLRVWRASEIGNVGTLDVQFDLSGLGPVTASDLRLLIDTDNDGAFADETPGGGGVLSGATALGGGIYKFTAVAALADAIRFTIGTIDQAQTTLPIELLNFDATCDNQKVLLNWCTASEHNNSYFQIERSVNGMSWDNIGIIKSKGNSSQMKTYTFESGLETTPMAFYYRLKQVDGDGSFTYSKTISDELCNRKPGEIKIYPNPSSEIIYLENVPIGSTITLTNLLGNVCMQAELTNGWVNLSELKPGSYFISIESSAKKLLLTEKIILIK